MREGFEPTHSEVRVLSSTTALSVLVEEEGKSFKIHSTTKPSCFYTKNPPVSKMNGQRKSLQSQEKSLSYLITRLGLCNECDPGVGSITFNTRAFYWKKEDMHYAMSKLDICNRLNRYGMNNR